MAYNIQRGLVGAARGYLGGYTTVLKGKAEEELRAKQEAALLQRQKTLAKYNSDLLVDRERTLLGEKRKYEEGREFVPYYSGDGIQVRKGEYEKMSPEERSALVGAQDYKMSQLEKEARKKAEITRSLSAEQRDKDIDQTISVMSSSLKLEEDQIPAIREFMKAEGITKPSQLKAALAATSKSLGPEQLKDITLSANKRANDDIAMMDKSELISTAESLGWQGSREEDARAFLKNGNKLAQSYAASDILFIAAVGNKSPSLLSIPASPTKEKKAVDTLVSNVVSGNISLEEVKQKSPSRYEEVKRQVEVKTMPLRKGSDRVPSLSLLSSPREGIEVEMGKRLEKGMTLGLPQRR